MKDDGRGNWIRFLLGGVPGAVAGGAIAAVVASATGLDTGYMVWLGVTAGWGIGGYAMLWFFKR